MTNYTKVELNYNLSRVHKEIKTDFYANHQKAISFFTETEKELNSKILKITMFIKDLYPELSKYIEEMNETIPDEKNPEITLKNLRTYYDSLDMMLNKYTLEHRVLVHQR